jgi:hypothetical protein
VTASGSFTLLAPQATNSSALTVGLDTSSAGARSGNAVVTLASDGNRHERPRRHRPALADRGP